MNYKHREVIEKYSLTLQHSIDLIEVKDSLRESKIFTAQMLKDIYDGEASFFEELPTRGPDAFFRFIELLKMNGLAPIAEDLCHVANPAYQISNKHGYHHVLLNSEIKEIKRSEESKQFKNLCISEATSLDSTLLKVGFESHKYQFLRADELLSELKIFSEKDFSDVNSCIIIILGFGTKNEDSKVICGGDGKYVLLRDILNLFSDTNCPSLKYKPKIFLLPSSDVSRIVSAEQVESLSNVNDTFIWYFPPVEIYKCVNKEKETQFFGQILSEKLIMHDDAFDFELILKSSYETFLNQFLERKILTEDLNSIPEFERLGNCREKILFTLKY